MAAVCARCSAPNPDGVRFCGGCGQPLPAAPAPTPGYADPAYVGGPGYPPPWVQPAVRVRAYRSGTALIAAGIGMVLALVGVAGVAVAALNSANDSARTISTTQPATRPLEVPFPSGGTSLATPGFSLQFDASAWKPLRAQSRGEALLQSRLGVIDVLVTRWNSGQTTSASLLQEVLQALARKHSDARLCIDPDDTFAIGGIKGSTAGLAFASQSPGGAATPVCDIVWISVGADGTTVHYYEQVIPGGARFEAGERLAAPVRASIRWKV